MTDGPVSAGDTEMTGNGPQTPAPALAPEARDLQPTLNPVYKPLEELEELEDPGKE